ncbi:MAG: hypothetical protein Q4F24_14995 [Eubacteriales bacterium]|nr:hypothetical protein [Eubacteriales bacterium]
MSAVLTSSQQTFVDITDQRKLSAYITSSLPKTQSENPNVLPHTYAPDWTATKLVLTPVIFLDQSNVALNATGLTITWKRKDGTGAEAALASGETVSGGVLTVAKNTLAASLSGMITYICYISYYDSETKNTVNISSDITYTLVKNAENARLAYIAADTHVFKYNTSSVLVGAAQATLTAQVQGVSVSKWQYRNSSGGWSDYPATSDNGSITGGTLVVKPAHAVFFNNVAQIKLLTDDADVYDTVTITKMYDGSKGDPGSAGTGGLSVILGNEAQTIACTSGGTVASAVDVTIPFTGYVGIAQTACSCTVGTLPSGVTVKSNTAATAAKAGTLVLAFAINATLGGASVLNGTVDLTFTISGKSVVKKFGWTKSNKGSSGANGVNAVVFSVYAPNGTIVMNQSGSLSLATVAYDGAAAITSGAAYQWAKYVSGKWTDITNATASTLAVSGSEIINIQSYRCTMTYGGKTYVDVITVEDKSDPYVSEMLSIGGFTVKNNLGGVVPYIIVRTNQKEVDALLGGISENPPSSPASGAFWYKVDHTAKTVTLMKYNGTEWANAAEAQSLTYTWYKQDKDGNAVEFGKSGKVIYLSAEDIDSLATLQCDVSN